MTYRWAGRFHGDEGLAHVDNGVPGLVTIGSGLSLTSGVLSSTGGAGVSDGDKGDITVSGGGTVWSLDAGVVDTTELADGAVTLAKTEMSTNRLLGRTTGGTGAAEEIAVGSGLSLSSGTLAATGGDPWTNVILDSDFTISTTSNNNVTGLSFTPSASTRYLVEGVLLLRTTTATTGPRPGISWPTGLSDGASYIFVPNSNTASAQRWQGALTTQNAASTGLPTTTDSYLGELRAYFITGGSPSGTFQVTLASETAAVNVTVKAGSFIRYRAIA